MHDLPIQGRLQQSHARPMSGEELEAMGKKAAVTWVDGKGTLSEAVVETVKHAGLSPEQVCRVIEFANTAAYLNEFKKEGSSNKFIDFPGGPADPSVVLKDLNDGGGGTVFDRGMGDYSGPPAESSKTASAAEDALFDMLRRDEAPLPAAEPFGELVDLRDKIAGAYDTTTAQITGLEVMYEDLADRIYKQVKQASLNGLELGEVLRAWSHVEPDPEYVKIAFALMTPRLLSDMVFSDLDAVGVSLEKTGAAKMVNMQHPLVQDFSEWTQVLNKLAELRSAKEMLETNLSATNEFLSNPSEEKIAGVFARMAGKVKGLFSGGAGQVAQGASHQQQLINLLQQHGAQQAAQQAVPMKGVLPAVGDFFESASKPVRQMGTSAGQMLFGQHSPMAQATGDVAGGLVQYAPHIAGAAGAYRLYQHLNAFGQSPMGQKLKSFVPGSPQNTMVNQELESRYSGQVPYLATGPFASY